MKVLKGGLTEIKYSWPEESKPQLISNLEPQCVDNYQKENGELEKELQELSRSSLNTHEVCYINGKNLNFLYTCWFIVEWH